MKILFKTYNHAFQNPGGGEKVLLKTKEALARQNVQVDLFDPWKTKYRDYDLIHDFSSLSFPEWEGLKSYGPKLAVTPVHWPAQNFMAKEKAWLKHVAKKCFMQAKVLDLFDAYPLCDLVFPTTELEKESLINFYNIKNTKNWHTIPNAVEERQVDKNISFKEKYGFKDYLLFVGRIGRIKNLKALIEASLKTNFPLVIIGEAPVEEKNYFLELKAMAKSHIHFIGSLAPDDPLLTSAYAEARGVIVPSLFETCSLVGMEAGMQATPVAMTKMGGTKEVYQDLVIYLDPTSETSIIEALEKLWQAKRNYALQSHLKNHFTWEKIALKLKSHYQSVIL